MAAVCEYAGVLGVMVGASRRYDGPMGKSDRAFVIGLIGVLLAPGWIDGAIVGWIAWAAAALCVLTGWRRVRQGLAEIG
jgi:CDP-diacylglycerol--glycerol-3-phosphate 3-phosphatidyltransferase